MVFHSHRAGHLDTVQWLYEELKPQTGVSSRMEELSIHFRYHDSRWEHSEIWGRISDMLTDNMQFPRLRQVKFELSGFDMYTAFLSTAEALEEGMKSLKAAGVLRVTRG